MVLKRTQLKPQPRVIATPIGKRAPAPKVVGKPFKIGGTNGKPKPPVRGTRIEEGKTFSATSLGDDLIRGRKRWLGPMHPHGFDATPRWNWNDGVTYSMLSAFNICPHSFWRSYVAGWQEIEEDGGLSPTGFGNLFHHLSERFFGEVPSKEDVLAEAYAYGEALRMRCTDQASTNAVDRLTLTCAMIYTRHQEHWNDTPTYRPDKFPPGTSSLLHAAHPDGVYDKEFFVVAREKTFKIKHWITPTLWVWLRGKIDGIFDVPVLNDRVVLENKTKGNIDEEGTEATLHEDLQTNIYLYAAHKIGYPIRRVLYNVIRRPKHSWNKAKETLQGHVDRIEEDTRKRPDHYFKRFDRTVDPGLVEVFIAHKLNSLLWQQHRWCKSIEPNPMEPWHLHDSQGNLLRNEEGGVVINLEHYERPYGIWDPYAMNAKGHQYEMRILNRYENYRQIDRAELFPELDDDSDAIIVEG